MGRHQAVAVAKVMVKVEEKRPLELQILPGFERVGWRMGFFTLARTSCKRVFSSCVYIYIYIGTVRISTYKGFINPSYQYPFRMPFIGAIISLITSRGPFCRNWWGDLFRDDY